MARRRDSAERLVADRLVQFLQGNVDGVVERGRSASRGATDRIFERAAISGEILANLNPRVEVNHGRDVLWTQLTNESHRRFLGGREIRFHAGARVDEQRQRERELPFRKNVTR